jgi:predicted AAA+ superfamily ATPase
MYNRLLSLPETFDHSFFLFGPRGTGKTSWIRKQFPEALYLDLLDSGLYTELLAKPEHLENLIPPNHKGWILIDEVQRIPALLNEVHRLIETRQCRFVLTGSSARSLRKKGVNLLAGRAYTFHLHPLTCEELGQDFQLLTALEFGLLPLAVAEKNAELFLEAYIQTYLREEVLQEGLTRNLGAFTHFLQVASFSQGQVLNVSEVARECKLNRKVVENYFSILEDLLIGACLPIFAKRASRQMVMHPKFYFFDAGVYRKLRPKGPLDSPQEIDGSALETLFLQHLRAYNDYFRLQSEIYYWRTVNGLEVDFVLYGPKGLFAFEIKRGRSISPKDLKGLQAFCTDYPEAKAFLLYGGSRKEYYGQIQVVPFLEFLQSLPQVIDSIK